MYYVSQIRDVIRGLSKRTPTANHALFLLAMGWKMILSIWMVEAAIHLQTNQHKWEFQDPKMKVPTISYHIQGLCKGISLQNMVSLVW